MKTMKVGTLGKKKAKPTPSYPNQPTEKQNSLNDSGNPKPRQYKTLAFQLQGNFDDVADPDKRAFLAKKYAKGFKGFVYGTKISETTGRYNTGSSK